MRNPPRLIFWWIAFTIPAFTQTSFPQTTADTARYRIRFVTSGELSERKAFRLAGFGPETRLTSAQLERGLEKLLAALRQTQFYEATIDSLSLAVVDEGRLSELSLQVTSGPHYELAVQVALADSHVSVTGWQNELRGTPDEHKWPARLSNVLREFARAGYPLASLELDSVIVTGERDASTRRADLYFTLDPGEAVRLDTIIVRGNTVTKSYVVLRELPVRAGDRFNLDRVESIPERLKRLRFLQEVAPPQLAIDAAGRHVLQVGVTEGSSNSLNGVLGYNPAVGDQKGYFTGLLDLKFGNLLGTGRLINARWEKRGRDTQELALRYREPWLAGYPLHLAGGFQQLIQDTLYVDRQWDLTAELPVAQRLTFLGRLAHQSITPDSLSAVILDLPASTTVAFTGGLQYDSRDDFINPHAGVFYYTAFESGRKRTAGNDSSGAQRFTREKIFIDMEWLQPTFWPQVLSVAVHGKLVTSSEPFVQLPDQFRFGGATTLRGYREEQFRGSRIAWSNLEYRYLLSRLSRAFVFFDIGYYYRMEPASPATPTALIITEEVKSSYGFGVRLDTRIGIVGVDYGLGEGDGLLDGKVHVSLVNTF